MKSKLLFSLGAASLLACLPTFAATVYVNETFDYADTAALSVNWGSPTGLSLDSASAGAHDGAASAHTWTGSSFSIAPTDDEPLVLTADLWYTGTAGQRNTVGLRNGANPLFEMGFYNDGTVGANGLATRVLSFAGSPGWVGLASYTDLGTGEDASQWIRLEATFTSTQLTLTWDFGANGSVDGTYSAPGGAFSEGASFTDLRFGGPSALSSAGGGFLVDNIVLQTVPVPEPASLAFAAIGAALAFRRRR